MPGTARQKMNPPKRQPAGKRRIKRPDAKRKPRRAGPSFETGGVTPQHPEPRGAAVRDPGTVMPKTIIPGTVMPEQAMVRLTACGKIMVRHVVSSCHHDPPPAVRPNPA